MTVKDFLQENVSKKKFHCVIVKTGVFVSDHSPSTTITYYGNSRKKRESAEYLEIAIFLKQTDTL